MGQRLLRHLHQLVARRDHGQGRASADQERVLADRSGHGYFRRAQPNARQQEQNSLLLITSPPVNVLPRSFGPRLHPGKAVAALFIQFHILVADNCVSPLRQHSPCHHLQAGGRLQ